jgi:thiol-disulfide isomerase/thioredoxin
VTAAARTPWLALLSFALTAIGCGQQDEIHTNIGPESNASAPTPATAPVVVTERAALESADNPAVRSVEEKDNVTLEKVTYDAFLKRVAANPKKPKFTIVDAWATWCGPCKENFPHVVEMHRKYADKGLAVASISFDDPANAKQVEEAKAFLREQKATCTNFLLDEAEGVGFEKFGVNGIPAVFLYGPDGKELKRFTMDDSRNQFTYDQVEKTVVALLGGSAS